MKTYTTTSIARIASGTLHLSPAQAAVRSHALKPLGKNLYEILFPVEFKIGETFGYDLDLPRTLAQALEETEAGSSLEELDPKALLAMARELGLNPDPKTGKPKLVKVIEAERERRKAIEQKQARIAELEAIGDNRSAEENAELESLTAQ